MAPVYSLPSAWSHLDLEKHPSKYDVEILPQMQRLLAEMSEGHELSQRKIIFIIYM
jgi:hypothetical protein